MKLITGQQFMWSYEQRRDGTSGDHDSHWKVVVGVHDSIEGLNADRQRVADYIMMQAERYPKQKWIRNVTPNMVRDVAYSEWSEL